MRVLAFDLQLAACRHEIVQKKSTGFCLRLTHAVYSFENDAGKIKMLIAPPRAESVASFFWGGLK